jgi:hypothetical protein
LELIEATEESVIIRTEIYDRRPLNRWSEQRVTLLGTQVFIRATARAALDE